MCIAICILSLFVVDGDAWIDDEFDFSYVSLTTDEVYPETCSAQCTHVWRAITQHVEHMDMAV